MSRHSRHQTVINREADSHINEDHWLKQFEKNLQKSAVQSKRVDQSLFEQINGIMNGRSKYNSVSAAVQDMMQRSGLTGYISKMSQQENVNSKKADDQSDLERRVDNFIDLEKWFQAGKVSGKIHKDPDEVIGILKKDSRIPKHEWLNFATGYSEGAELNEKDKDRNYQRIQDMLKTASKKDLSNQRVEISIKGDLPVLLKKVPAILKTFENYIKDTRGNLPVPAIVEKVKSIHRNDVADARDWEDNNLLSFVSNKNLEEKASNSASDSNYHHLGQRDTSFDANDSNTDAFSGLMPAKI